MDLAEVLRKLKLKEGQKAVALNAPEALGDELASSGFADAAAPGDDFEFTLLFTANRQEVDHLLPPAVAASRYDGLFWLCYPKGSSKIKTDINRDSLWRLLEPLGLRPVSLVSVDATWSAMRLRPAAEVKSKGRSA